MVKGVMDMYDDDAENDTRQWKPSLYVNFAMQQTTQNHGIWLIKITKHASIVNHRYLTNSLFLTKCMSK